MNRTISLARGTAEEGGGVVRFRTLVRGGILSAKLSEQFAGLEDLNQRAERGSIEKFRAALQQSPDVEARRVRSVLRLRASTEAPFNESASTVSPTNLPRGLEPRKHSWGN